MTNIENALVILSLLISIGCGGPTNHAPNTESPSKLASDLLRIHDWILEIDKISVEAAQDVRSAVEAYEQVNSDDVRVKCSRQPGRATNVFDSIAAFDPLADVLWPGSLVQGSSLRSAVLTPIAVRRAHGKLTLVSAPQRPGTTDEPLLSDSQEFEPSLANATQAAREILAANLTGETPARISYHLEEFHSFEQAMLSIGASAEWLTGDVRATLQSETSFQASKYVVSFVQAYYSLAFSPPSSPTGVFATDVKVADLQPYMGEGNPPVYISSVTYGRMLVLLIDSQESSEQLRAALQASLSSVVAQGELEVSAQNARTLQNSNIRILSLGGSAQTTVALLAASNKLDALEKYLREGANFSASSPGVPISYQARYLRDNSAARISFVADYIINHCERPGDYVRPATVTIRQLEFHDTADDDEDLSFSVKIELLRQDGSVSATLTASRGDTYVEEQGKVGWKDNKNKFFMGTTQSTNDAIFSARVIVAVRSLDGDGKRWGTNTQVFHAPFREEEQMDGGHDGNWRLFFRVR